MTVRPLVLFGPFSRDLDGALVRLRAGVAEEHLLHARQSAEPLRQLGLERMIIEIRAVHGGGSLLRDGPRDSRMAMPHRADRDPREEIQIPPPLGIPETR